MKVDVDCKERVKIILSFLLQSYKVVMGSMLLLFVPQTCEDGICSVTDNLRNTGNIKEHKYLSGRYLITALRHKITPEEYEMVVEASKDSYLSEPSVGFEANIPRTQTPDGTDYVEEGR